MANRTEYEDCGGGLRITRLVSTDKVVTVPSDHDGKPVVSLGPRILVGSPPADGRTVRIPSTVTDMDPETLCGIIGIKRVEYDGELEVFNSFGAVTETDCTLVCRNSGSEYTFDFLARHPMSFPGFDDALMSMNMRMSPEIAARRLRDPIGLSEKARARYEKVLSEVLMPRAEQAVSKGDVKALRELFSTGMVSDADISRLMERSLRSGKTGITSALMSEVLRRYLEKRV